MRIKRWCLFSVHFSFGLYAWNQHSFNQLHICINRYIFLNIYMYKLVLVVSQFQLLCQFGNPSICGWRKVKFGTFKKLCPSFFVSFPSVRWFYFISSLLHYIFAYTRIYIYLSFTPFMIMKRYVIAKRREANKINWIRMQWKTIPVSAQKWFCFAYHFPQLRTVYGDRGHAEKSRSIQWFFIICYSSFFFQ